MDDSRLLAEARKRYTCEKNPLVSVCIPTYNRGKLLAGRTIPSVLRQTYRNFEIVIVGDGCTDDTAKRLRALGDSRIRFHNFKKRSRYPADPLERWCVAGVPPLNAAIEMSNGSWIAPMGDDDEFLPNHIEALLRFAQKKDLEFVYGAADAEEESGAWKRIGEYPPRCGQITDSAVVYRSELRCFKYDPECWRTKTPSDWALFSRMIRAGVHIGFLDKVVTKHHFSERRPVAQMRRHLEFQRLRENPLRTAGLALKALLHPVRAARRVGQFLGKDKKASPRRDLNP